jgi:urease accessory protein
VKADEGNAPRRRRESLSPTPSFRGWQAQLRLGFVRKRGGTRLASALHTGPLRVQRPFHPEGDAGPCHVYVLHPPGGVVSGDQLELDVQLDEATHVLLTAPGATKLYRARRAPAGGAEAAGSERQPNIEAAGSGQGPHSSAPASWGQHGAVGVSIRQRFRVGPGARVEWLPHETIAYDGAQAALSTRVELAEDATYVGWELLCLGRPAAGERFRQGELRSELAIVRAGRLVYLERGHFRGGDAVLDAPWGLSGQPVLATFVVAAPGAHDDWLSAVREQVVSEAGLFALTLVSGVLIARFLGGSTREARALFEQAYAVLRPLYAGRQAVHPRIWST